MQGHGEQLVEALGLRVFRVSSCGISVMCAFTIGHQDLSRVFHDGEPQLACKPLKRHGRNPKP